VRFAPRLKAKEQVIARMGMGHVIRVVLRVDARVWKRLLPDILRRHARGGFGFVHSRLEGVPVWWALSSAPVLTGWVGGPAAARLAMRSRCAIFERSLSSLSRVFGMTTVSLRRAVVGWETHNWPRDPFSRGAYSFITAREEEGAAKLREPIEDTIFFAGEATADGEEVGTVHGAIASGERAANEVSRVLRTEARL
jgi:monoamine oxidase